MRFCSIASGSSGNCIYVGSDHTHVLVDAGISGKRIEQGLNTLELTGKDLDAILVTHEHADHIQGLGVMARRYGIPLYMTGGTADYLYRTGAAGRIPEGLIHEIVEDEDFTAGDLVIHPFTIPHDAAQPVGYRLTHCGKSVGIATDLGKFTDYIVENLENLEVLLLESNHDVNMLQVGPYPYLLKQRILGDRGHLSNENAGRLLGRVLHDDMKAVFLGHLSQENNFPELAFETVCQEVTFGDNPYKASDFDISIAGRNLVSQAVEL